MREFCWSCHRPIATCFCAITRPFASSAEFALVVHPDEVKSTVGTAWILRRSISNSKWFRSKGNGLDTDLGFLECLSAPNIVPLLLFPGPQAFSLSHDSTAAWRNLVSASKRPLFIVIDGTWTQAHAMLRKSKLLQSLPRISFQTVRASEYGFKIQPHPNCLSSVEGVHHVIELLAARGWGSLPADREHDQMIEIFRNMAKFQAKQERNPRMDSRVVLRNLSKASLTRYTIKKPPL
ncbi:MAG: tRNA-uridine aminocarboxypropyltransferase [Bdellovibrionota bacterium]